MQKNGGFLDNLGGCLQTLGVMAIFLLIGAGLSWWGSTILQTARASAAWPVVEGLVVVSEVEKSSDGDGGDTYTPHVTYTYSVNGGSFENKTIKFGENTYTREKTAREIASRYPVGQVVTVHFDPENPGRSVLEPGVSWGSYIILFIGLIFVGVSFLSPLIQMIQYLRRSK